MRLLSTSALIVCVCAGVAQEMQDSLELARARAELVRTEKLVAEGGLPRNRLEQARDNFQEAQDQAILSRTLYGVQRIEDLTGPLAASMTQTAARLVQRQSARVAEQRKLVDAGVQSRSSLTPLIEELDSRRRTLHLAESRARLWNELMEMARAEQQRILEGEQLAARHAEDAAAPEDENGILHPARIRRLESDFEKVFSKALPVSARGDTVFHRTLGFNHAGRIDVAVTPDSAEGQWLRNWLDRGAVPYIAFRSAVKGQSSAAHIHIGPPSSRLRAAD